MNVNDNKWLKVKPSVVLTPIIIPVICGMDKYFEGLPSLVTSGKRDANNQLSVIREYLIKKGLNKTYPLAMTCKVDDKDTSGYVWQMAWSNLLHLGTIINPAYDATCLMHTTFDNRDRYGQLIHQTPHARGTAFNIGGGGNGVDDEAERVQRALDAKLPGLVSFLKERDNNAIHCDCR